MCTDLSAHGPVDDRVGARHPCRRHDDGGEVDEDEIAVAHHLHEEAPGSRRRPVVPADGRQQPDDGRRRPANGDDDNGLAGRHGRRVAQREDDGPEAVDGDGDEREDRGGAEQHQQRVHGDAGGKVCRQADAGGHGSRDADEAHQQVGRRQRDHVVVGDRPQHDVLDEDGDDEHVTDDGDDGAQRLHDDVRHVEFGRHRHVEEVWTHRGPGRLYGSTVARQRAGPGPGPDALVYCRQAASGAGCTGLLLPGGERARVRSQLYGSTVARLRAGSGPEPAVRVYCRQAASGLGSVAGCTGLLSPGGERARSGAGCTGLLSPGGERGRLYGSTVARQRAGPRAEPAVRVYGRQAASGPGSGAGYTGLRSPGGERARVRSRLYGSTVARRRAGIIRVTRRLLGPLSAHTLQADTTGGYCALTTRCAPVITAPPIMSTGLR